MGSIRPTAPISAFLSPAAPPPAHRQGLVSRRIYPVHGDSRRRPPRQGAAVPLLQPGGGAPPCCDRAACSPPCGHTGPGHLRGGRGGGEHLPAGAGTRAGRRAAGAAPACAGGRQAGASFCARRRRRHLWRDRAAAGRPRPEEERPAHVGAGADAGPGRRRSLDRISLRYSISTRTSARASCGWRHGGCSMRCGHSTARATRIPISCWPTGWWNMRPTLASRRRTA